MSFCVLNAEWDACAETTFTVQDALRVKMPVILMRAIFEIDNGATKDLGIKTPSR